MLEDRLMRPLIWVLLLGASALAQTARWAGQPEYRSFAGAPTSAGPALDRSYALVYPAQGPFRGTVLLVPGLLGGATSFDALARRLVLAAPGWEVGAWDRRANGLEDRRGFLGADPWAYYQRYALPGFPFLKDWGLRVHLQDLDALVDAARPRGPVVLAGHSLGASLSAAYAQWKGEKLAGLAWIDGAPSPNRLTREQYLEGGLGGFGRSPGLNELLTGQATPYLEFSFLGLGLSPAFLARAEALAFLAARDPEADAPSGAARFPASLEAAALAQIDDRYNPVALFSASVGRAWGREGFSLLRLLQGQLGYALIGPRGRRVEWQDTGEATDPREFLGLYAWPETGFSEWFFPVRLSLDLAAWDLAVPELQPRRLGFAVLGLGAGRGAVTDAARFAAARALFPSTEVHGEVLPGLTHLDVLLGREGPAVGPLAHYLEALP